MRKKKNERRENINTYKKACLDEKKLFSFSPLSVINILPLLYIFLLKLLHSLLQLFYSDLNMWVNKSFLHFPFIVGEKIFWWNLFLIKCFWCILRGCTSKILTKLNFYHTFPFKCMTNEFYTRFTMKLVWGCSQGHCPSH